MGCRAGCWGQLYTHRLARTSFFMLLQAPRNVQRGGGCYYLQVKLLLWASKGAVQINSSIARLLHARRKRLHSVVAAVYKTAKTIVKTSYWSVTGAEASERRANGLLYNPHLPRTPSWGHEQPCRSSTGEDILIAPSTHTHTQVVSSLQVVSIRATL